MSLQRDRDFAFLNHLLGDILAKEKSVCNVAAQFCVPVLMDRISGAFMCLPNHLQSLSEQGKLPVYERRLYSEYTKHVIRNAASGMHSGFVNASQEAWVAARNQGSTYLTFRHWIVVQLESLLPKDDNVADDKTGTGAYLQVLRAFLRTDFKTTTEPAVRVFDSTGKEDVWLMEPNLFDRWGAFNDFNIEHKPTLSAWAKLSVEDLDFALDNSVEEMCFIGTKAGVPGIFVEFEVQSLSTVSDGERKTANDLYSAEVLVPALKKSLTTEKYHEQFPGVEFCLADHQDYQGTEGHALMAFVPLDVLKKEAIPFKYMVELCRAIWAGYDRCEKELPPLKTA